MDKKTLEKMATQAFDNIKSCRIDLFDAAELTLELKSELEKEESAALVSGKFDGKNAETRKAQAREYFSSVYERIEQAEAKERSMRYAFDLAQFDVDAVKTLLRIAEISQEL